ncbi:guanylate kinase [Paenibacillus sp. CGMCC 1.16610]|uniref:Guanylate kinase n=1 Tax=Paenibacillus anseongense TaxID=2682845 RepID=A0ABW9U0C2_9BACL|nr:MULTISPECIES: guanylate kinase [Paenibacillus]MBA2943053.1 guanylate kinase [Paenibacillus sp. CGMCC 1.16610]MVQ33549.1 guanylate kinase [Paenibacillus anseongense]
MYALKDKEMIFVFTGPHGAGRKTVAEMSGSTLGMKQVISYTTRPPRATEEDGQDYHFISPAQFVQAQANGEFIEVSTVNDHLYGIKSADIEQMFEHSGSIYLILNRFGAETLKKHYGDHVVLVFIYAQRNILEERMRESGDSEEIIQKYLSYYEDELAFRDQCDHVFENVDLAHTVFDLTKTLDKYLNRNLVDLD